MNYNAVYVAQEVSQTYTGAATLLELQVASGTIIEIIRAWCGPAEDATPVDEMQDIQIYGNDAASTGGAALTEQAIQGAVPATPGVTAIGGSTTITQGGTPTTLYADAFHLQNGWLYLPVPEERIRVVGGATIDNVGLDLVSFNPTTATISYGMIWGELKG